MNKDNKPRLRTRAIVVFLSVLIIGVAGCMLVSPFFNVDEVVCEGNNRLTADEIIQSSGIVYGKNILMQGTGRARRSISGIPMIESVSVKRILPNKIKITVNERVPAAYISSGGALAVVDTGGRVLEMISDDRVGKITMANTPKSKDESENTGKGNSDKVNSDSETNKSDNAESGNAANDSGENKSNDNGEQSDSTDNSADSTAAEITAEEGNPYTVPLVSGLELSKAEPGRQAESQTGDKLSTALNLFGNLDKTGLLNRATYIDITDLSDVTLVIENRIEIQLGNLNNIEYRCAFLAKVINEKISPTEHVVMDYRTDDIYVRQPDDGKERMVPKPSATAKPQSSDDSETADNESDTNTPDSADTEQEYL